MNTRGIVRSLGILGLVLSVVCGSARAADASGEEEIAVAVLDSVSGVVEVERDGEWLEGAEGAELALDDRVRTDADSFARLRFLDDDEASGAEATLVDLSPDTTVSLEELAVDREEGEAQRTGLMGLLRGAVNAITKGWGSGSLFSVRAGTTVCGIRGSIANVGYEPEDGEATVTSLEGEMFTFEARDDAEALKRTRQAVRDLRRGSKVPFLRPLKVGNQLLRQAQGRVRVQRLRLDRLVEARKAARESRRLGPGPARKWLNQFAKVRPPARRPGRLAREKLQQKIQDLSRRRRPKGILKRLRNRQQIMPTGGRRVAPPRRRPEKDLLEKPSLRERLQKQRQKNRRIRRKRRQIRPRAPRLFRRR